MRIGINVSQYNSLEGGGSTYAAGLLRILSQGDPGHEFLIFSNPTDPEKWRTEAAGKFPITVIEDQILRPRSKPEIFRRLLFDLGWLPSAKRVAKQLDDEVDVIHFTGDRISPYILRKPKVLSFFGGNYWAMPYNRYWQRGIGHHLIKRNLVHSLHQAQAVLVPSVYLKNLLVQSLQIPCQKIFVCQLVSWVSSIRDLVTAEGQDRVKQSFDLPNQFFLYSATAYPYKNHARLFRAMRELSSRFGLDVPLYCTGHESPYLRNLSDETQAQEQVRYLGYVSRSDLANLYSLATAYVHPSLYEAGGSFSMYEAMYCGCPVLCSRIGSMVEMTPGSALHFDPYHVEDLVLNLRDLTRSARTRERLLERTEEWLASFSVSRAVDSLACAYDYAIRSFRDSQS